MRILPLLLLALTAQAADLRVGMIGLDTSHVVEFTRLLNDASRPDHVSGARVVAAFKGGSPDVPESATRIDKFTAELTQKWGVELVASIEELSRKVDAVMLMSVDGRPHLNQVRPVLAAHRRVFIDKPLAGSLRDALEIARLSRETGTPFFSSSSNRFVEDLQEARKDATLGTIVGAEVYGPMTIQSHMPDLFWYGIHSVEALYTLLGPGCETLTRTHSEGSDVVTCRWKDGRIGSMRGLREGAHPFGGVVFGSKMVRHLNRPPKGEYRALVLEIVKFFETGVPPVSPDETLEIMAFMEAADLSKSRGGAPVRLKELLGAGQASLVIRNAKIVTVDPQFSLAQALAIQNGRFVAVGSTVDDWIGPNTKIIDAQGRTVLPGLIDSHVHAAGVSNNLASDQPFEELPSIAAMQQWIRQAALRARAGEWIIVPRSYPTRLKEHRFPTRAELDAATTLRPVLFDAAYCQVLNTLGLRQAGIHKASPPLAVGEIVRDAQGEPTGLLRNAMAYLQKFVYHPAPSRNAWLEGLQRVHERYRSLGITSVVERAASPDDYGLYQELYRAGRLAVRSRVTLRFPNTNATDAETFLSSLGVGPHQGTPQQGDDWLRLGPLKVFVDGGILIGTAYMREPYGPGAAALYSLSDPGYRGSLSVSLPVLTELFRIGHRRGWPMSTHVTGDGGVDLVLEALEKVNQEIPLTERRFNLIHAYFPHPDSIEKARRLGVILDTQPAWFYRDADVLSSALGAGRMSHFLGVADWLRGGVKVVANTDHMLGLDPDRALNPFNPFLTLYVLVTRKTESGRVLGPDQRVSREDALRMMTINAAYMTFDERQKGSIEPGKLADLAIVSDNYLNCPADNIRKIRALTTIIGGDIVYQAQVP